MHDNHLLSATLPSFTSYPERIKREPFWFSWNMPHPNEGLKDSISEKEELDYEGLSDHEKLALYVYAHTKAEYVSRRRHIMKEFGWTAYKTRKLIKEINTADTKYQISNEPCFDQETGLLNGSGYIFYNWTNIHL